MNLQNEKNRRAGERSFTLLETMIAMTILVTVMLHVSASQGNMVYNANYARRMTEAMWLARGVMAKVDYYWDYQEFKQLEQEGKLERAQFKEMELPEDTDYTYSLKIEEWKFPILELLQSGGFSTGEGEDKDAEAPQESPFPIKDILKQILGDHILKVAHVEVFWPEGAKEHSVTLTYLLTNQRQIDQHMASLQPTYDKMLKFIKNEGKQKPKNTAECKEQEGKDYVFDPKSKSCKTTAQMNQPKQAGGQNPTDEQEQPEGGGNAEEE